MSNENNGGLSSVVCETSLFNRVERENILSIVESTTSSLSRQDAPLSASLIDRTSNPQSYFYATLQQQPNTTSSQSATSGGGVNSGNNNLINSPNNNTGGPNNSNTNANSNNNANNTNNNNNNNNKVTFDPNLEYI